MFRSSRSFDPAAFSDSPHRANQSRRGVCIEPCIVSRALTSANHTSLGSGEHQSAPEGERRQAQHRRRLNACHGSRRMRPCTTAAKGRTSLGPSRIRVKSDARRVKETQKNVVGEDRQHRHRQVNSNVLIRNSPGRDEQGHWLDREWNPSTRSNCVASRADSLSCARKHGW